MKTGWSIWSRQWSLWTGLLAGVMLSALVFVATPALSQDVERARTVFGESSVAAEQALELALEQAAPEARFDLERALGEVRAARERTARELADVRNAPRAVGRARAREAVDRGTQIHLRVLQDALGKVPEQARPAIERALRVSGAGRATALRALDAEAAPGAGSAGLPPEVTTRSPAGIRTGPPAGIRTGPPAGVGGGPPDGIRRR